MGHNNLSFFSLSFLANLATMMATWYAAIDARKFKFVNFFDMSNNDFIIFFIAVCGNT